jgi:hypothetical protein
LSKDDASSSRKLDDSAWRQKMQLGGNGGRLLSWNGMTMRFVPPELVKELPLRDPIGTDTRSKGF